MADSRAGDDVDAAVSQELHRLPSAEEEGLAAAERRHRRLAIAARRTRLRLLFDALAPTAARDLFERLGSPRPGDALARRFHDVLARPTRAELLGVLQASATRAAGAQPSYGEILRLDETVPLGGLPGAQPNYADRAFQGIESAPVGDDYVLFPKYEAGRGENGLSIAKSEFHLDDDPLAGFVVLGDRVYRSRAAADAVLADLRRTPPAPGTQFVLYYLRGGYVFPTTLSETTVPVLVDNLRRKRAQDRADVAATADLAESVLWWYVGARFPLKLGRGAPIASVPVPPAAAAAAFDAARVAEGLLAGVRTIASPGEKMLAAARTLSAMRNLSAAQKVDVILEFFGRTGFAISRAGVVDEGAQFVMYAETGQRAFRFVKATGEIVYGKFDAQRLTYIWQAL